jgi:L-amino acid N-acyltransferase YncA
VGRALVSRAIEEADKRHVNTVRASTGPNNTASQAMLHAAGFIAEQPMSYLIYDIQQGNRLPN